MLKKLLVFLLLLALAVGLGGCGEKGLTVVTVEASELQNYAIDSDGGLWFWGTTYGRDPHAQLSDLAACLSTDPQKIMDGVKDVKASETFALILKSDGSLWGWGSYPDTQERINPAEKLAEGIVQISAEGLSLYALDTDGVLWDWGTAEKSQLPGGDGNTYELHRPTQVMEGVRQVSATDTGAYFLCEDGSFWQRSGLLGNQKRSESVPHIVAGTYRFASIDADGTLWTWENEGEMTQVAGNVSMAAVERMGPEAGQDSVLYVTEDHSLWLLGYDIRSGKQEDVPVKLMDQVAQVSLSGSHVLVATTDGKLYGWGNNQTGALAAFSGAQSTQPVEIVLD